MKHLLCLLLLSLTVSLPGKSYAVSVNEGGYGQALIFPFFSAAQGNMSLITIANDLPTSPSSIPLPTAVKIRLLGSADGVELFSFNVYLGQGDAWVAAIHTADGQALVSSPHQACVLSASDQGLPVIIPQDIGSIEIIQMASVTDEDLAQAINERECATIQARWTEGPWNDTPATDLVPPTAGLRGSLILIHVDKGTSYSVPALALADFSDIVQHSDPADEMPNLSSVHDAGTDTGLGTTSSVCLHGECIEDQWASPADAVSAVLTARELHGEFVIEEGLAAESEWIVAYPTRRYSDTTPDADQQQVSLLLRDRDGKEAMPQPCVPEDPSPYACQSSYHLSHTELLEVASFGEHEDDFAQAAVSAILGMDFHVDFPSQNSAPVPPSGTARLGFHGALASMSGRIYLGAPVVGYGLQEYTNAFLSGESGQTQRANYGVALPLSRVIRID
jgi:hypothetical protein